MYYSITGKVILANEGRLVVDCNGVGYDIAVSNNALVRLGKVGEVVTVFTYLQVSEDALRLYGFYSKEEKTMFENLITISGVGPKLAVQILSGAELSRLAVAIVNSDVKALAGIKGIGKKTAERIILELKGKLEQEVSTDTSLVGDSVIVTASSDEITKDAVMALMSFGVSRAQAEQAVAAVRNKAKDLEGVIALAFRSLA